MSSGWIVRPPMGHNGHGINLYGVVMIIKGVLHPYPDVAETLVTNVLH